MQFEEGGLDAMVEANAVAMSPAGSILLTGQLASSAVISAFTLKDNVTLWNLAIQTCSCSSSLVPYQHADFE